MYIYIFEIRNILPVRMVRCNDILDGLFSYETPKIVHIRSRTVGVLSRFVQLAILGYIIGYVLVYKKGYQEFSDVESSATTKIKGVVYTNFSDDEFDPHIVNRDLYRRVWDVADYVIPPSENGAVFVATNVLITSNQTQSECPEDETIPGAGCDPENNTCVAGKSLPVGNGQMTGRCVNTTSGNYSCEINAWCPVEVDISPLKNKKPLLAGSQDFTVLIKNFVEFPKFKNSNRRNIKDTTDRKYLESCRYNSVTDPDCPVFRLGDIVHWAGQDYNKIAYKGGVIAIVINWNCNLDFDKKYCLPTYSFTRLDDPNAKLAPGWNFRYANYYNDSQRTLYKVYGIKFSIIVQGQAGKFFIVPLLLNVGAGLGLLAVQVVVCDLVVLYLLKKRNYYKSKKYEQVDFDSDENSTLTGEDYLQSQYQISSGLRPSVEDGYQRAPKP